MSLRKISFLRGFKSVQKVVNGIIVRDDKTLA